MSENTDFLEGKRIAFIGQLAGMTRREAARLVRHHGAVVLDRPDASAHLVVLGEDGLPIPGTDPDEPWLDDAVRAAAEQGSLEVLTESQFWQRLNLAGPAGDGELPQDADFRLYTPAMLAELLGVSVAVIRRWHRRGLIVPVREVRRLPYFDFQEVATARRLAQLLAAGVSPTEIEKKLADLARLLPDVQRPLAQLSVIVQGREILLHQGDGLIEAGGQLRFDFDAPAAPPPVPQEPPAEAPSPAAGILRSTEDIAISPEQMRQLAADLEDAGRLSEAADVYRAAMAAAGPDAESCFQLAELLYPQGDLSGARERYSMAIELDEDYVEARANLGCVLVETGRRDLAEAAFEGALRYHPGYADVYYHLARLLDEMGRCQEAERHWRMFLELAPNNPWAAEAAARLQ